MRILIDECLSPRLVQVAHNAGFEAYHVVHRGWSGFEDDQLFELIQGEGFTFVTNNRDDFLTLVNRADLHAGLIVILPNAARSAQIDLFKGALALAASGSMINCVIEVASDGIATRYEIPGL